VLVLPLQLFQRRSGLKRYEDKKLTKFEEEEERMRNDEKTLAIIADLSGTVSEEAGAALGAS
jgi:hypothetical protein